MIAPQYPAALASPQPGHFDLGTGHHGDLWLDLDALFLRPALLRPYVGWLAEQLGAHRVDAVCGPLEGGAFLAHAVAETLDIAFLPAYRDNRNEPAGYQLARVTGCCRGACVVRAFLPGRHDDEPGLAGRRVPAVR